MFSTKKNTPAPVTEAAAPAPAEPPAEPADEGIKAKLERFPSDVRGQVEKLLQAEGDRIRLRLHRTIKDRDKQVADAEAARVKAEETAAAAGEEKEKAVAQAKLQAVLLDAGVDATLAPLIVGENEAETKRRLDLLMLAFRNYRRKVSDTILRAHGTPFTVTPSPVGNTLTLEQIKKMPEKEVGQRWDEVRTALRRYNIES